MNDMSAMLSSILENPEGMEQLKGMASALLGDKADDILGGLGMGKSPEEPQNSGMNIDPSQMQTMMSMMSAFGQKADDHRTKLLLSLRPHLSEKRQKRVDNAVKILKLVHLAPALSKLGLFENFAF